MCRRASALVSARRGKGSFAPTLSGRNATPFDHYFKALLTSENSALNRVPRFVKTVIKTIAIKDEINAYSMAVAPCSSATNLLTRFIMFCSRGKVLQVERGLPPLWNRRVRPMKQLYLGKRRSEIVETT